jgi:outer membrane lipoprotein-sorting protein
LRRSGASHRRHRPRAALRIAVALCAAALLASPAPAVPQTGESPATLEALMRGMAGASGVEARFREQKQLALLSEPIESRGTLYFVPPNRLCRETLEPSASRLVIDGDRVTFRDAAGGGQAVDLSASPIAREYVANFVVLFGGDLDALRKRYEPHFRADANGWTLELVPRAARLREFITRVTLSGRGRALERMEMVEAGGDRTTTWFEAVRSDRVFSDAELARIFSEPSAPAR